MLAFQESRTGILSFGYARATEVIRFGSGIKPFEGVAGKTNAGGP
jgi:hypothetical protein